MQRVSGGCHCGNVGVDLEITREPFTYRPRACDCDFCRKHGAAYISDPQGALTIGIRDARQTVNYRQGSGRAECLFCSNCGVLVGALYRKENRIYGVVNVRIVADQTSFGAEQPASPKMLSESEKIRRWQEIWFANVTIAIADTRNLP